MSTQPSFLDAFRVQKLLPFELDGRQHPVSDLLAHRVVEHLDVLEHALPGFLAGFVRSAPDALALAWSLTLSRYGDSLAQAHVGLYISTTVIGCIFCLVHLPQAAVVVAACVMPAFLMSFAIRDQGMFAPMALNVVLVLAVLLRVLFNSFNIFRQECEARSELDRLYLENRQMADSDALTGLHNRRRF